MKLALFVTAFCLSVALFPGDTVGQDAGEATSKLKDIRARAKQLLQEIVKKGVNEYTEQRLALLRKKYQDLKEKLKKRLKGGEKKQVEEQLEKVEETLEQAEEKVEEAE
uniref:Lysine--tRNA ligase n=1 Tax=Lygus hesperus TaxID=30085 RepID=A0A0A9WEN2_LYGHE